MDQESPRKDVTNPIGLYGKTNGHKAYGQGKKGNGRREAQWAIRADAFAQTILVHGGTKEGNVSLKAHTPFTPQETNKIQYT